MTAWMATVGLLFALMAVFIGVVIRADRRAEEAHNRWYADPRHVWNGGQRDESNP